MGLSVWHRSTLSFRQLPESDSNAACGEEGKHVNTLTWQGKHCSSHTSRFWLHNYQIHSSVQSSGTPGAALHAQSVCMAEKPTVKDVLCIHLVHLITLFPSAVTDFRLIILQNAHVSPMTELRNWKLLLHLELGLDYRLQISLPHTVPPDSW